MKDLTTLHETEDFSLFAETCGRGFTFLHLNVHNFNKTILEEMRYFFDGFCKEAYNRGVRELFFYTNDMQTLKFAGMVRPVDDYTKVDDVITGMWELDEWQSD